VTGDGPSPCCAVVVVHFGDPAVTLRCLAAIANDPSAVRREVVVVDNSATFPADRLGEGVRLVVPGRNLGFGAGVNAGVAFFREVLPETIVFMNHDVEIQPGFLGAAAAAVAVPGVGAAAGPLFLDGPEGPLWYAGGEVRLATGTVWQSRRPLDASRARDVGFLTGAAAAVRREAWRSIEGFDPAYFLYNEDLDLCLRLRRRGWRLRFAPGMRAVHYLGAATGSRRFSPLYLEQLASTRLRPFRPLAFRLYLALVHSGWVALRGAALAITGDQEGAAALLRGHRRALATITAGPR